MTILVGHTNGTDGGQEHDTTYGSGMAIVIVLLGMVAIGLVLTTPYFLGDSYYTPLSVSRKPTQVVLVRADTPVVQGKPVATPGGTLVTTVEVPPTPDLSCLKTV